MYPVAIFCRDLRQGGFISAKNIHVNITEVVCLLLSPCQIAPLDACDLRFSPETGKRALTQYWLIIART